MLAAVMMTSCTFLGLTDDTTELGITDIRELDSAVWSKKAIAYSGYREGQSPDDSKYPSEAEIQEDLNLLVSEGFGLIRLYDSSEHAERTLNVIDSYDLDIKVMLGAYLYGEEAAFSSSNYAQLDGVVDLANQYPDIITAVSVGNEVLVDWSFAAVPPADMVDYITYVRESISQPVTVNDNFEAYAMGSGYNTEQVWRHVDFAAVHTYAYWDSGYDLWEWRNEDTSEDQRARSMMDAALAYAQSNFTTVRSALDAAGIDIPIVIGETGWQSTPGAGISSAQYLGHPVNQKMYYEDMREWVYGNGGDDPGDGFTRPAGLFYFEAFDEPWKGTDDYWGLWDKDRNKKYILSDTGYSLDDAVFYTPPAAAEQISEDTFLVFRDAEAAEGEASADHQWNAWENGTTAGISTGEDAPPEGDTYAVVTPTPLSWGWGMTLGTADPLDLSLFETSGNLVFKIKTAYPGSLEIGFFTGFTGDSQGVDVYLTVDPASNDYGCSNDGEWHEVTIPIADITPNAAPAYGMDASAELNMEEVYSSFVIADRFSVTGNSSSTEEIKLDDIRWEK